MAARTTVEAQTQLLKRLQQAPDLAPCELALYDRQFRLLAVSAPQAALCGNPGNPFCSTACHARRTAELAASEADDSPRLLHCPGSLQHCLVPYRDADGRRHYLLIGGGRESQANLPYLEELANRQQIAALPLLERWDQLPPAEPPQLLAAASTAQALLAPPAATSFAAASDSLILTDALIEALAQAETALAAATDPASLNAALGTVLTPVFGPAAASLLAPEDPANADTLESLHLGSFADYGYATTAGTAGGEQLTCLPLRGPNGLLGCLVLSCACPSARDMQLLDLLAERTAQRLQQLSDAPAKSTAQPAAPLPFGDLLNLTEPGEICQRILAEAVALVPAGKASLMVRNRTGSKLRLLASIGMNRAMATNLSVPADQGIAGQVLRTGQPLLVEDLERDPRISASPRPRFQSKSLLCLPLTANQEHQGVISLTDRQDGRPFSENDLAQLAPLVEQAALLIERLRSREQLSELRDLTALDPETGVYSESMFRRRFEEEVSRASRLNQSCALLLFAADPAAAQDDRLPFELAERLLNLVRKMDVVGRLDTRLFAVLLPDISGEVALAIAERLHGNDEEEDSEDNALDVSCGLALYPQHGVTYKTLLQSAHRALQKAQQLGGRRSALCETSARNDKIVFL